MNWEAISAVGQIVGAAGVIISVIYLAQQVRSNARQTRLALFSDFFYSRPRPVELPARWGGSLEALLRRIDLGAQTEWTLDGPALRQAGETGYRPRSTRPGACCGRSVSRRAILRANGCAG